MRKTIIDFWKKGRKKKEISRLLKIDIKTVRKIISHYDSTGETEPSKKPRVSKCDFYKDKIEDYISKGYSVLRIFEELKKEGASFSYSSLSNYTRSLRDVDKDFCTRFHSLPGEEAQVDFGYVGYQYDPNNKLRKCWVFAKRLSYSRLDYYELVFDQTVETFIKCHINSFNYFKGVPQTVKIDNLKAGVIDASFYDPVYQPLYERFSNFYNFRIVPCRVRQPQEKGKVESGVKYYKNNFIVGRSFKDHSDLISQSKDWMDNYCNKRIHGTTKKQPYDVFINEEQSNLRALPVDSFCIGNSCKRKVGRDCHITVENNYYSVPYGYVGEYVFVEILDKVLLIYSKEFSKIACHAIAKGSGNFCTREEHYPNKKFDPNDKAFISKYQLEMEELGNYGSLIFAYIIKEKPHMWHRTIKGILSLKKIYSKDIVNLSCKRALHYGISNYSKIASICKSGAYMAPLEGDYSYENIESLKTEICNITTNTNLNDNIQEL